jgi:hypothetical protein
MRLRSIYESEESGVAPRQVAPSRRLGLHQRSVSRFGDPVPDLHELDPTLAGSEHLHSTDGRSGSRLADIARHGGVLDVAGLDGSADIVRTISAFSALEPDVELARSIGVARVPPRMATAWR